MKNIRNEDGAITVIVLVSMLLFIFVLIGTYLINASVKKAQLKSQILLRDEYAETLNNNTEKEKISANLVGANIE